MFSLSESLSPLPSRLRLILTPLVSPKSSTRHSRFGHNQTLILRFSRPSMSNLRTVCRPHTVFSSLICCRNQARARIVSFANPNRPKRGGLSSPARLGWVLSRGAAPWFRASQRRTVVRASSDWKDQKSPYETLELGRDADEEQIKVAYRRLAKFYHPDVYDGKGTLEEGETAEARFIKIQAAYELLVDEEKRRDYDSDNRVNPMKASEAWMEWLIKKRKAFNQRGDMAVAAWAEQQQRELNLRARRLARYKIDPEEERKILAKEKKASKEYFSNTLKRHTLVLKKRDLMRKKAEEDNKSLVSKLLAAEGFELESDDEEDRKTL